MGKRREKIILVDLDGTLISCNSFPKWVVFLLLSSFRQLRWWVTVKVAFWLLWRKLGFISHQRFKRDLMRLTYPDFYDLAFAKTLLPYLNDAVVAAVQAEDAAVRVLSTAAPVNYAAHLVDLLGVDFQRLHSTQVHDGQLRENVGEHKVQSLRRDFPGDLDITLYTDHRDDIPLMKISANVILVNPSKKCTAAIESCGIKYSKILSGIEST